MSDDRGKEGQQDRELLVLRRRIELMSEPRPQFFLLGILSRFASSASAKL